MRVAAIELFVRVQRPRRGMAVGDAEAVVAALVADPQQRNRIALGAIAAAARLDPDILLCPGWTFVGRAPSVAALRRASGGAAVLFEVPAGGAAGGGKLRGHTKEAASVTPYVLQDGKLTAQPPQVFAFSSQLDDRCALDEVARPFAAAVLDGRQVAGGIVLCCGEVNAVRMEIQKGVGVKHYWDETVASVLPESAFKRAVVFNPAHTPNSSRITAKRRGGPWAAVVSTTNRLDRRQLGRKSNLPAPAHAAVGERDRASAGEKVLGPDGSRVVVYDLDGWWLLRPARRNQQRGKS